MTLLTAIKSGIGCRGPFATATRTATETSGIKLMLNLKEFVKV